MKTKGGVKLGQGEWQVMKKRNGEELQWSERNKKFPTPMACMEIYRIEIPNGNINQ